MFLEALYIVIFLINILIILKLNKIAEAINIYDKPDQIRKFHKKSIPLIGGLILLISLNIIFLFDFYFNYLHFDKNIKFYLFIFCNIFFLLGLIDDKKPINPNIKFLIQIILSYLFIKFYHNFFLIDYLKFSLHNYIFFLNDFEVIFYTICIVILVNALNMYDGINGQTSTYFMLILFLMLIKNYNFHLIFLLLLTNLFIFYLNIRDKIFFGDSGIYLLAFLLSFLTIDAHQNNLVFADEIFLIFLLPGIDMCRLFFLRIAKKKNPFFPDRNHLHHLLLKKFNNKITLSFLTTLSIFPYILFLIFNSVVSVAVFLLLYFLIIIKLSKENLKIN